MKAKLVLVAAVLCLVAADKENKDRAKLQGTWVVESVERAGKKVDLETEKDVPRKVTFEGNKVKAIRGEKEREGTFKLGKEGDVTTIDLTPTDPERKDKVVKAIYKLEGDTLKICVNEETPDDRPKELASKEGTKQVLVTFKREKK